MSNTNYLNPNNYVSMHTPPVNNSWNEFKGNWKNVTFGGLRYLSKYPSASLSAFKNRLAFALLKRSVMHPYYTPEGFKIISNREMLSHAQIFIEENLYWPNMFKELSMYGGKDLHVLDVGSNAGFFSQWLGAKVKNLTFHLFDPVEDHNLRAAQINWDNRAILNGPKSRQFLLLNTVAVGETELDEVTFNVGELVTKEAVRTCLTQAKVAQITIDSYNKNTPTRPYFCLKIDTDGMNLEVLKGAVKTLPYIKWILIEKEKDHENVHSFLKRNRFDYQGKTSPHDLVYLNSQAHISWLEHEFEEAVNWAMSNHKFEESIYREKQLEFPNLNLESKSDGLD